MSQQPDVLVPDLAESLFIHPFMLSRWRKDARGGLLTGAAFVRVPEAVAPQPSFQVNVYATQGHVFGASELSAKSSST